MVARRLSPSDVSSPLHSPVRTPRAYYGRRRPCAVFTGTQQYCTTRAQSFPAPDPNQNVAFYALPTMTCTIYSALIKGSVHYVKYRACEPAVEYVPAAVPAASCHRASLPIATATTIGVHACCAAALMPYLHSAAHGTHSRKTYRSGPISHVGWPPISGNAATCPGARPGPGPGCARAPTPRASQGRP